MSETDARGHKTEYTVDEDTSRNEVVTDRCGNKTAYEYDASGKTTKVTSKKADNTEIANVSYAYDTFDNMTEIVRGDGMKYALAYNAFHNLESIGIDGKDEKLVQYTYKNGNGRLKEIAYANGDNMKAIYNSAGQMIAEKWFNSANALTAHYKYVYDGKGNIVRSIDFLGKKEYNYEYEDSKVVRATECDITLNGETVTSKVVVNTVKYYYDNESKQTKKVIAPASRSAQTIYFESNDDNTVVKFSAGDRTVTSHSKSDSFGRKVFDELQLGTGFVSRQFSYHAGEVTEEHKDAAKLKSSATTQLVSQIVLSGGRAISYEYDAEERITKVTDSVDGTTEYTYDALGQLLTEIHEGEVINTMTYDNYGNILTKNGVAYTYDSTWKDLLTGYGEQTITYDAQGNPTSYLGHTLTWDKGRQLKSFDGNSYTYNANGIRTSKVVDGVKHTYILDGTKILREEWGENTIVPLYDNEGAVCGIIYNEIPFYFVKNYLDDIISIVDKNTKVVARYSYDAWGVCTVTQDSSDCGIATINPYRYRGYYYDNDIEMYYLQSRYYDAFVGRFINADAIAMLSLQTDEKFAHNLFVYCCNDPVDFFDELGIFKLSLGAKIAIGLVGIVAAIVITIASGGSALPALLTILKQVLGSMVISMAIQGIIGYIVGGKSGLKQGLLDGAADGFMWGGIGAAISAVSKVISMGKCGKLFSSKCFVAGTLVSTPTGQISIENIKIGDCVYAFDENAKKEVIGTVEDVFVSKTNQTISLFVNGHKIESTAEHPYYVVGNGWVSAEKIRCGDVLLDSEGKCICVEKVEKTVYEYPIKVYNFRVKDYHTYFVSSARILVHNANCGMKNIRTLQKTKIKGYNITMDVERGGSGLINVHLEVDGLKYFWDGNKFLTKAGKELPKVLRNNDKILKALKKALEKIAQGAI